MEIVSGIKKIMEKNDLSQNEMIDIMNQIMEGRATDAQIAGFLVALRLKGETVDEISGAAQVMREKSLKLDHNIETLLDTCGTGGDSSGTFNISTASAFILAAGGISVAKHGNRSVSSKSGSADVLEALGVNINIDKTKLEKALKEIGIAFMYAVKHHGSMKYAIGPRKELGVRTVFNIIGPLTNPANANIQIMGVYSAKLVKPIAKVLKTLGLKSAMVVHGEDGLDELTITGKTIVAELKDGEIKEYKIDANDYFEKATLEDLKGGDSQENAQIIKDIFEGKISGAKKDVLALNSGAAFYIAGKVENIKEGIELANEIIESGKAMKKLNEYINFTNN